MAKTCTDQICLLYLAAGLLGRGSFLACILQHEGYPLQLFERVYLLRRVAAASMEAQAAAVPPPPPMMPGPAPQPLSATSALTAWLLSRGCTSSQAIRAAAELGSMLDSMPDQVQGLHLGADLAGCLATSLQGGFPLGSHQHPQVCAIV